MFREKGTLTIAACRPRGADGQRRLFDDRGERIGPEDVAGTELTPAWRVEGQELNTDVLLDPTIQVIVTPVSDEGEIEGVLAWAAATTHFFRGNRTVLRKQLCVTDPERHLSPRDIGKLADLGVIVTYADLRELAMPPRIE